ncbi:MAG: DUF6169 family protein [Candidatus Cryptobacteroides sp.]
MKQLSLASINNKSPLEVSFTPSGTFSFGKEKNTYIVGFVEDQTILDEGVYQFFIENVDKKKNVLSTNVCQTIIAIIEEFFVANDSAILYICDVSDGKQSARDRLFAMWFNSYDGKFNYTLSRVSINIDGVDYYASLLISNLNPSYAEVLSAFNDFISEFISKVE